MGNRFRVYPALFGLALFVGMSSPSSADPMSLGFLSYDSVAPGSDQFNINNLTGFAELAADFPVNVNVTFLNAQLELFGPSAPLTPIALGNVGPGFPAAGSEYFADTSQFTSAVFTATLDVTSLSFDPNGNETVDSSITATLLPSPGDTYLAAGETTIIEASPAAVPEPSAFSLLSLVALGSLLRFVAYRREA